MYFTHISQETFFTSQLQKKKELIIFFITKTTRKEKKAKLGNAVLGL